MARRRGGRVGGGLQVDLHRARPGGVPVVVGGVVGDRLEDAGIVDQHVDPAVEPVERRVPERARRGGIGEVGGDQLVAAARRMADDRGGRCA